MNNNIMTLEQKVQDLEIRVRKLERAKQDKNRKETTKKPKCYCGAELESDGTCNSCGFDATEIDIY